MYATFAHRFGVYTALLITTSPPSPRHPQRSPHNPYQLPNLFCPHRYPHQVLFHPIPFRLFYFHSLASFPFLSLSPSHIRVGLGDCGGKLTHLISLGCPNNVYAHASVNSVPKLGPFSTSRASKNLFAFSSSWNRMLNKYPPPPPGFRYRAREEEEG
ncbi:hypothetical protein K440DRAFT_332939 [Wilcoxina mikolae CBS 423.85]|nr:hypothetical protein K440DRAFT_332939 [Wilcoxina mikolae CBS 423.85]